MANGNPPNSAPYSDAAKRAADTVNLHLTFNKWWDIRDKYIAFRMSDGTSDGVLYDTKRDAVTHQLSEQQCFYVSFRNLMNGASPREMQAYINFVRDAYDHGFRLVDPDDVNGGPEVVMTTPQRDYWNNMQMLRNLRRGLSN